MITTGAKVNPADYAVSDTATDNTLANNGVDVGWITTSKVEMTVKHHFDGVARGENFSVTGVNAGDGSDQALAMHNATAANVGATSRIDDTDFKGALLVGDETTDLDPETGDPVKDPCATSAYSNPIAGLHRPDTCFRAVTAGDTKTGINYLGGYSLELAAKDSGVSWGKVAWDPNPFKDLKCESMSFMATEVMEADVCDLFEDEVDAAVEKMWGGSEGKTVNVLAADSSRTTGRPARSAYTALAAADPGDNTNLHLVALQIEAPAAESRRFASLWYNDNDKRNDSKDKSNHDLYADIDTTTTGVQRTPLHIELVDSDGDPKYGDFGKVDFVKPDGTDANFDNEYGEDGVAESPAGGETTCSHSDGEGCDGMLEETITVTFDAGLALGCSTKRDVMVTCEWDANGEMGRYRADDHVDQINLGRADDPATTGAGNDESVTATFDGFVATPAAGAARVDGDISAFVSCKVSGS